MLPLGIAVPSLLRIEFFNKTSHFSTQVWHCHLKMVLLALKVTHLLPNLQNFGVRRQGRHRHQVGASVGRRRRRRRHSRR